jgi:spore germination protein GerM
MRRPISSSWLIALLVGTLATIGALGGCGVPADGGPHAIPRADLPPDLLDPNPGSSTTLPESAGTTTVEVYLVEEIADGVRLVAVDREVAQADIPNERLATLFGGATETEVRSGITSSIPADTVLLDVMTDEENREVVIDLSDDIFTIEGEALEQAFAQMVWTATEPEAGGYDQVRFLVDGRRTTVIDGDGVEQDAVMRRSYGELAPLP